MSSPSLHRTPSRGGYDPDDLVTGEAVALETPVASVAVRMVSGLVDVVATVGVLVVVSSLVGVLTGSASEAVQRTGAILVAAGCLVGLPVALETATRGRTLGKLVLGLRTVRDDGGPITARHALVRALVGVVEVYALVGAPALVSALVSRRGVRLGDLAAGTYVIAQRTRLRRLPPVPVPPGLEAWARVADVATLPDGLAVAARQLLLRAATLAPDSRARRGADLRAALLEHVAPPPPEGWPDEAVIAAVLAERGRRDGARLERDAALVRRVLPADPLDPHRHPDPPGSHR